MRNTLYDIGISFSEDFFSIIVLFLSRNNFYIHTLFTENTHLLENILYFASFVFFMFERLPRIARAKKVNGAAKIVHSVHSCSSVPNFALVLKHAH